MLLRTARDSRPDRLAKRPERAEVLLVASSGDHNRCGSRGSVPVRRSRHGPPGDLRREPGPHRPAVAHRAPGLPGGHTLLRPVARTRPALPPRALRGGDPVIFVTLGTHE